MITDGLGLRLIQVKIVIKCHHPSVLNARKQTVGHHQPIIGAMRFTCGGVHVIANEYSEPISKQRRSLAIMLVHVATVGIQVPQYQDVLDHGGLDRSRDHVTQRIHFFMLLVGVGVHIDHNKVW